MNDLLEDVKRLTSELSQLEADHSNDNAVSKKNIDDLTAKLLAEETKISEHEKNIEKLQGQIVDKKKESEAITTTIAGINKQMDDIASKISACQKEA